MSSRSGVLDPRSDCAAIARELGTIAFPWDTTRSLELALFRTFASPRIRGLLHRTGEFESVDYPQGYEIESLGPPP